VTLTEAQKRAASKPARVVVLPPSAFADSWSSKPKAEVAIGIRFVSEHDLQIAKAEASRSVERLYVDKDGATIDHEKLVESWNDALIRWIVAVGTCDANDVSKPYFAFAQDTVAIALTPQGVRRLWDEIEQLAIEFGPASTEAGDEAVAALAARLAGGDALSGLDPARSGRVRRLLAAAGDLLSPQ
jgi:hypothetical protein